VPVIGVAVNVTEEKSFWTYSPTRLDGDLWLRCMGDPRCHLRLNEHCSCVAAPTLGVGGADGSETTVVTECCSCSTTSTSLSWCTAAVVLRAVRERVAPSRAGQ